METAVTSASFGMRQPAATNRAGAGANQPVGHNDEDHEHAALLTAIAAGDAKALDELYRHYRPVAFAAAYAILRDPHAAEDTVHDAFLSVWRGAASFQPARGSLRGWLLTIVRNGAIDHLRARRLTPRPHLTPELEPRHVPIEDDVATTVAAAADANRLHAALRALPLAQQNALELAFFAGLTHGEIAARTGLPLGTMKGRVRLGLRRLRHELRDLAPATPLALATGD
jgi:RNA polymerase sigma-70 factor (ECF subfamily)